MGNNATPTGHDALREATMDKPDHHILVCMSFRGLEPKGTCIRKGAPDLVAHLDAEIAARGLNAFVSTTGCLQFCDKGPVLVVYPQGHWYGGVDDEDAVDAILDALEAGEPCTALLLT
ncbi:(2Fe-2S) ferredoxin domain-containing protein [Nitratidesulfovibrio vulgaris]|uniref:(2Fe-2S) ferredoxin domain-containing protein n=1 Tax=Nitratidesulfovibrio vulgaris TaxID=881 RepID=UPI001F14A8F6|nr:(2Fe-2S) ferredoxin domain-containing protein [Nitratidesulfovibrio vulgaris]